jgi:predicted HTH transcriptional regulator
MNSEGGILLIGVEDDGKISGVEKDYESFSGKKNWDGWLQHFTNVIKEHIGMDVMIYIKPRAAITDGKTVARIDIRRRSKPIYVEYQDIKGQNKMEFYIRATGTTYALNPKQTNDFIKERWKDT